jgi:hypothetical protein
MNSHSQFYERLFFFTPLPGSERRLALDAADVHWEVLQSQQLADGLDLADVILIVISDALHGRAIALTDGLAVFQQFGL